MFKKNKESGASLIEITVTVAIIGILIFIFSDVVLNNSKVENKLNIANELEDLRKYIRFGTDLTKTKVSMPSPCSANTKISLKRNNNTDLVKNSTGSSRTKIGAYFIEARCLDATKPGEIQIYYTKVATVSPGTKLFEVPLVIP